MPLDGVNKLCAKCMCECKQFSQITILKCPSFRSREKLSSNSGVKSSESEV